MLFDDNEIDIHNLFFPAQHITDPKWFSGRKSDIEQALNALNKPGSSMVVFGERGSGKTSFVEMIKLLAIGESSHLLFKHGFQKRFKVKNLNYKVVSFTCNEKDCTVSTVLQNLITNTNGIKSLVSDRPESTETIIKAKLGVDLKLITAGGEDISRIIKKEFKEKSVVELFTNLITIISREVLLENEGLLIVIDEFDLVLDSEVLAPIIKALSIGKIKFLISGIAESYDKLLKGHKSVARQFLHGRIHINLMNEDEIKEVYDLVTENTKNKIRFDANFHKSVLEKSNGLPYWVQLFGELALDASNTSTKIKDVIVLTNKHLESGIKKLGVYEYTMEKDYLDIVKDNKHKELAIRLIASNGSKKVNENDLFSEFFKRDIRQPIPKNTLSSLLAHREPQFLVRTGSKSEFIKFSDTVFRTFVNCRHLELIKKKKNKYEM